VWTLKLRSGVKFSDGTAFDAAAVKFNWDRAKDPAELSPAASIMKQVTSMQIIDPVTLKITLTAANSAFPAVIATTGPMTLIGLPAASAKSEPAYGSAPVGAGPYLLKEWVRRDHMTLVRNPTYYGKTYLDQIIIRDIPDEQQRYNTLLSGGADMSFTS